MAETKKPEAKKKTAPKKETEKKPAARKTAAPKADAEKKASSASKAPAKTEAKAEAKKPEAKKAPAKKAKAPAVKAKKPGVKYIRVTQVGSPIGRQDYQRQTLVGLGLNRMHRSRELEDTPAIRGMANSIPHLVKVEEVA